MHVFGKYDPLFSKRSKCKADVEAREKEAAWEKMPKSMRSFE